jgi:hypothetical protein
MAFAADEYSNAPLKCPKCGMTATSVFKTGNKVFYNHGDATAEYKDGKLDVNWKSCMDDRLSTKQP